MKIIEKNKNYGLITFRLGILLLASAPFISALLLFTSGTLSFLNKKIKITIGKKDYFFIVAAILMIIVSFVHFFNYENTIFLYKIWNPNQEISESFPISYDFYSSFIGLANWIPLFFCFFGFQNYLKTNKEREIVIKLFVAGSVPVLVSGLGQLVFDWNEPLSLLNGLIIWFQKPGATFSGLFNNQNYAGCWLNIVWPFSIAIFFDKTKDIFGKTSSLIFLLLIFFASFLTFSRNAWGGLLLTAPLVLGPLSLYFLLILSILLMIIIFLKASNFLPENINYFLNLILPAKFNIFDRVMSNFSATSYPNPANSRESIFIFAFKKILEKPFLGWGAAIFPIYYGFQKGIYISHVHNLILDTAFNYGLIVVILIFSNILLICISSFKKIYLQGLENISENYYQRSWWTSFFVLLCSQMVDVQYYDLRISISFWILISGLKCIISDNSENKICTIQQS